MKELRYHPVYPDLIMNTAQDGFHVFKPALDGAIIEDSEDEDE